MRADRLLSLMLLLRARGHMTAYALAEELGVSERTVYRDIDALSLAGVPVYTQSGANGGVFLDKQYRISLTGLSRGEVLALFVESDAGPLHDLGMGRAADESRMKLYAALPNRHQQDVAHIRQRFYIDPVGWLAGQPPAEALSVLQEAVWSDRVVTFGYQDTGGGMRARTVAAYALVAKASIWYLVGRKADGATRTYRVSRMGDVRMVGEAFARDETFDLVAYWQDSRTHFEREMAAQFPAYRVRLAVHPEGMWYFPSFMNGRYQVEETGADGWATLHVTFGGEMEAVMAVIGLAGRVRTLAPSGLHVRVRRQAEAILRQEVDD